MLIFWILIFVASLALMVKSADWLVESAEKIGLALKISPFIVGVTIVGIGTSFPELASSLAAVFKGSSEIVVANAIGSNIANVLLIVGLSALVARRLIVKRSLIDLDAPLLTAVTVFFLFIIWDREVVFGEGILLLLAFLVYLLYTVFHKREDKEDMSEIVEVLPSRIERREKKAGIKKAPFLFLFLGMIGLAVAANYTIESVLKISELLKISASLIAIIAIAIGTSLPELVVSLRAALKKKYEIALGNVFGSNVFNILLIVGLPALIRPLIVDDLTFNIGLPFLILVTLLFVISSVSRKIHCWEGAMYLLLYILFIVKLCGLF